MKKIKPLDYTQLRAAYHQEQFRFKSTKQVKLLSSEFVGQKRALAALTFGVDIQKQGYNIYAMGPTGIGKRSLIKTVLTKKAKEMKTPPDWCYLYNFENPDKPIPIALKAGYGERLVYDLKKAFDECCTDLITFFEGCEYREGIQKIEAFYDKKRNKINQKNINKNKNKYTEQCTHFYKEQTDKEKALQVSSANAILQPTFNRLKKKYRKHPLLIKYLSNMQHDMVHQSHDLIRPDEKTNLLSTTTDVQILAKYKINLLVNNKNLRGAPVIFEESPTYTSLVSRIEYISQLGTLITNFTLIKPGALHLANGGFLIIEMRKIKKNRQAWEALKEAIYSNSIKIQQIEHDQDSVKTSSLEPTAIPLKIKVVLLGDRNTYYSLCQRDADFIELFKVAVDFDEQIDRSRQNTQLYIKLIATIIKREKLQPFSATAVAEIIDYSARLADDIEKLTTHVQEIEDLIQEANYWASQQQKKIVDASDVNWAIQAQISRMNRARDLYYEDIYRNYIIIYTHGHLIGQVNCLSVRRVGNFSYGHPTRVSATVRLGKGKIIDIQREVKLAGPLHSKAGLIISHYLASHFNENMPFALSASVAFEQIYCWTEGDSASVGELCALLSALAFVPINQALAITGSIDQYGEVQAIGGANEKIEGFFEICKMKGLDGTQGVIIPAVNKRNLVLKQEIIDAAKNNLFSIYLINHLDEAVYLLMGIEAGKRNDKGEYAKDSLYDKIEKRLQEFTRNHKK